MKGFKNILCVVGPGDASESTLERSVTLAKNNQARLTVVSLVDKVTHRIVIPEDPSRTLDLQELMISAGERRLETMVEPHRSRIDINTKVLVGVPFLEVIRCVLRDEHDLLIKTPENPNWLERLFGSDEMQLMRKCPCPVWMVKPHATQSYQRIVAAVDTDEDHPEAELETRRVLNEQVLELAVSLALSEFAELHLVSVWSALGEGPMRSGFVKTPEEDIDAYVGRLQAQHESRLSHLLHQATDNLGPEAAGYLKPQRHLLKGNPRKEIPLFAADINADLVVMGTVARTGIPGFVMGNTAEAILSQLTCSVLAIKPPGFVTPVTQAS